MNKFRNYTLTQSTEKLKELIAENPDLPIVVLAGEEANIGDDYWMFCTNISFSIEEILDYDIWDYGDAVFTDRGRFEEYIEEELWDEYHDKSNEEYDIAVKKEVEKYEPYWKEVIAIWADN